MSFKDYIKFFSTFVTNPSGTGAIAPSSQNLCGEMVAWINWKHTHVAIECGPGTGVFTEYILAMMHHGTMFLSIEVDPDFAAMLRMRFPKVPIYQDSVANVKKICAQEGISEVDAIICGLPWALFSEEDQHNYLDAMLTVLRPGGQFATFAYLQGLLLPAGKRFQRKLQQKFSEVTCSHTVWFNIPPAFVYRCRR